MSADQYVKVGVGIFACLFLVYIMYDYNMRAQNKQKESFYVDAAGAPVAASSASGVHAQVPSSASAMSKKPVDANMVRPVAPAAAAASGAVPQDCFPRDRLTADDLLPKDAVDSKWAQVNPAGQGDVKDQNFLSAGYHVGINTVGSSLRNANLQLRSEPIIPQAVISPFLNTTISPDLNRKAFEIGGDF